jgi:hypothetical protein
MPVKGVISGGCLPCGAKCRTKGGAPCLSPAMKGSNRCRMHFGHSRKLKTHGRLTIQAKSDRKQQRILLKDMKTINQEIEKMNEERTA